MLPVRPSLLPLGFSPIAKRARVARGRVSACCLVVFSKKFLVPVRSHSLCHQPLCLGGGGFHFLCWIGLVSPLMYPPIAKRTKPPNFSCSPINGPLKHPYRQHTGPYSLCLCESLCLMCQCQCLCVRACVCTCLFVRACARMYMCVRVCVHARVHKHTSDLKKLSLRRPSTQIRCSGWYRCRTVRCHRQ